MAFGTQQKMSYKWKAKQRREDQNRDYRAELLLIKDYDWEDKVVPGMNALTCNEMRRLAFETKQIEIKKNF